MEEETVETVELLNLPKLGEAFFEGGKIATESVAVCVDSSRALEGSRLDGS